MRPTSGIYMVQLGPKVWPNRKNITSTIHQWTASWNCNNPENVERECFTTEQCATRAPVTGSILPPVNGAVLLAMDGHDLVGWVKVRSSSRQVEIFALCVVYTHRGRGVAPQLLAHVQRLWHGSTFSLTVFQPSSGSTLAHRVGLQRYHKLITMYTKLGFALTGESYSVAGGQYVRMATHHIHVPPPDFPCTFLGKTLK